MSSIKSTMQMLNLGLSIFNKLQTMQHRQIKLAHHLANTRKSRQSFTPIIDAPIDATEAEIVASDTFKQI